jgi:hypothetical protein
MSRKKADQSVEIDRRDPNKELWQWLLAESWQRPEVRAKQSLIAKTTRDDAYWEDHAASVAEDHRRKREIWATDRATLDKGKSPG